MTVCRPRTAARTRISRRPRAACDHSDPTAIHTQHNHAAGNGNQLESLGELSGTTKDKQPIDLPRERVAAVEAIKEAFTNNSNTFTFKKKEPASEQELLDINATLMAMDVEYGQFLHQHTLDGCVLHAVVHCACQRASGTTWVQAYLGMPCATSIC